MQQFNLDTWLKDKSRKVITRDEREVEILKTDFHGYKQIIGVVKNRDNKDDEVDQWNKEGNFRGIFGESKYDLFFADEEEELTEFEKVVQSMLNEPHFQDIEAVKQFSKELLDLAKKEIRKEQQDKLGTLEMPIDVTEPYYIKGYDQAMQDFLEKACKWLQDSLDRRYVVRNFHTGEYYSIQDMIKDFKNYMQDEM